MSRSLTASALLVYHPQDTRRYTLANNIARNMERLLSEGPSADHTGTAVAKPPEVRVSDTITFENGTLCLWCPSRSCSTSCVTPSTSWSVLTPPAS